MYSKGCAQHCISEEKQKLHTVEGNRKFFIEMAVPRESPNSRGALDVQSRREDSRERKNQG